MKGEMSMSKQYPRGKLSDEDEGAVELRVVAYTPGNAVVIEFANSVKWVALSVSEALAFAEIVKAKALELQDEPQVNTVAPDDVQ